MPSLFSLFVDLKANTADFVSGMEKSSFAAKKFARDTQQSFSQLGSLGAKALAPLGEVGATLGEVFKGLSDSAGAAFGKFSALESINVGGVLTSVGASAIAAAAAMAAFAIKGSELVESLERMGQKTGIGVEQLQILGAAGTSVGVSLDDVVTGMRKFDQVLTGTGRGSAVLQASLKALGVTAKDNWGALLQLADAFAKMEDGPRKSALAVELLGRSGLNLIPILDKGRDGIEEFESIIQEFGPIISARAVQATDDWKTSTLELSESWKRVEVDTEKAILPLFSWMAEKLAVATAGWAKFGETVAHAVDQANERIGSEGSLSPEEISNPASELGKQGIDQGAMARSIAIAQATAAMAAIEKQKSSYKDLFDFLAAGGQQQLQLQHLRENLEEAIVLEDYKQAAALQQQITALQEAIKLEEQRERLRESIFNQAGKMALASPRLPEGFKKYPEPAVPEISAGTPFSAPLDTSAAAANTKASNDFNKMISDYHAGQAAAAEFWKSYGTAATNTLASINYEYDNQKANWYDMLNSQTISQQQFDAISIQLEKNRMDAVVGMYQAQRQEAGKMDELTINDPFTSMSDKFKAFANQIELQGQDLGPKVFASLSKAVDDVSTQLAKFVVTGKSNFRELFQSLEESVAKAGFQRLFGSITKAIVGQPQPGAAGPNAPGGTGGILPGSLGMGQKLAGIFGVGAKTGTPAIGAAAGPNGSAANPFYVIQASAASLAGAPNTNSTFGNLFGGKSSSTGGLLGGNAADGTESNPFYTVPVDASGNQVFGSGGDFSFLSGDSDDNSSSGGFGNLLGPIFGGSSDGDESSSGSSSGGGGLLSSIIGIASIFGGGMAAGGDVTAGKAYIVGEKHPEFFVPRQAGQIAPSLKMSGGNTTNVQMHIYGVSDADSFKRSQSQIHARLHRELGIAGQRNG